MSGDQFEGYLFMPIHQTQYEDWLRGGTGGRSASSQSPMATQESNNWLKVTCDSCKPKTEWFSRLGSPSNESSSSLNESGSNAPLFAFDGSGTPLFVGFYLLLLNCKSTAPCKFRFDTFLVLQREMPIDGWDIVQEDKFRLRQNWINSDKEELEFELRQRL